MLLRNWNCLIKKYKQKAKKDEDRLTQKQVFAMRNPYVQKKGGA